MPLPLVPLLMGGAALFSGATNLWNIHQSRQMTRRSEAYSRRQSSDLNRWMADYERNTGLKPQYRYLGQSGQSEYLKDVQLPNYGNMYSMNTANALGTLSRTAFGVGFAYNHYRNNMGYRPSPSKPGSYDPTYG